MTQSEFKVFVYLLHGGCMRRTLHAQLSSKTASILEAWELRKRGLTVVIEDQDGVRIEEEQI